MKALISHWSTIPLITTFQWSSLAGLLAIFFGIYLIPRSYKIKIISKKFPINIILSAAVLFISGIYMLFNSWKYHPILETYYISSIFGIFICLTEMNSYYLEKKKTIACKIFNKIKLFKYFSVLIVIEYFFGPVRRVSYAYWDINSYKINFWYDLSSFLFIYLTLLPFLKSKSHIFDRIFIKTSNADELKKYSELKDQGIITEEEFKAKKKKLLDL